MSAPRPTPARRAPVAVAHAGLQDVANSSVLQAPDGADQRPIDRGRPGAPGTFTLTGRQTLPRSRQEKP
jgi:hypothetical protein